MGRPKKNDVVNTVKKKVEMVEITDVELLDGEIVEKKKYKECNPHMMPIDLVRIEKVVYKNMMAGRSTLKIRDMLKDEYKMTDRSMIYKLLKKVQDRILDTVKEDLDEIKSNMIGEYHDLYMRAIEKDDLRTALSVLDSLSKIYGLAQNKIEINTGNVYKVEF